MGDSIHSLEKQIRSSSDINLFKNGFFAGRITQLLSVFPSNSIYFIRIIREYNKKLNEFNLSSLIINPIDAGFGPLDDSFFGTVIQPRQQKNQGHSSSDVQAIWEGGNNVYTVSSRSLQFIKRNITTSDGTQDNVHAPSSDRRIRIFSFGQPIGYGSGNFASDLNHPKSLQAGYPVRFRVSFTVTENSGHSVNQSRGQNRTPTVTNNAVYFVYKDHDAVVNYPKYLNKNFFAITAGFNAFEFEIFNDGDNSLPAMDIMVHSNAILDIDIKDIQIRHIPN